MSWAGFGKLIGKGIVWLVRNPEAINTAAQVLQKAKRDKQRAGGK